MPQKRNPDAAELTRAKVGRIVGAFVALCTILKGLPLTYGKDMQEDKEPLFDAADSLELGIAAMAGMVRDLKANPERMRAVASADYSVATDLADWLVRKVGLPFRQAHHVTGRLVGIAADKGVDLDKLTLGRDAGGRAQDRSRRLSRADGRGVGQCAQEPGRHRARQRRARRGRGPALVFLGARARGRAAMSFSSSYKNGEMHAEGVALATIAAQVGTPFYCYSAGALRAAWKEFADGIKGMNAEVCYAMKANSQPGGGPPVRRAGGGVRHRVGGRDAPRAGGRRVRPSASSIPVSARRPRS